MKLFRQKNSLKQLKNLVRDQSGNTLVIMTASLIPIIGLIGSAVDLGRGYMTRTRLQQACDTGVLAARKTLNSTSILTDPGAQSEARKFFEHNFANGTFGVDTDASTFALGEGSEPGTINGQANVQVPTTLFRIFGRDSIDVGVECNSDIDIGNTDIMLSLDVTLSMNAPIPGGSGSRLDALKLAVERFYTVIGPGDVGSGNTGRVRYGFVPYAGNVNVGRILYNGTGPDDRWLIGEGAIPGTSVPGGIRRTRLHTRRINNRNGAITYGRQNVFFGDFTESIDPANPEAQPRSQPLGMTERWEGCIVERPTVHILPSATSIPSGALDLDIDLIPTNDKDTRWTPHWRSQIYFGSPIERHFSDYNNRQNPDRLGRCPSESRKLSSYASYDDGTSNDLESYIDNLSPTLVTNHTIGLVWAARLLSPTGLFSSENSSAPNGRPITRHIVFMTDGEMFIRDDDYDVNGFHRVEGQILPPGASNFQLLQAQENRFSLVCDRVKSMGINIWVVEFNDFPTVSPLMSACASNPSQAFVATDQNQLINAFTNIANQIGGLRLSS